MILSIHPDAREEFLQAVEFYSAESVRAAEEFIEEFEQATENVSLFPHRYRLIKASIT